MTGYLVCQVFVHRIRNRSDINCAFRGFRLSRRVSLSLNQNGCVRAHGHFSNDERHTNIAELHLVDLPAINSLMDLEELFLNGSGVDYTQGSGGGGGVVPKKREAEGAHSLWARRGQCERTR